MELTPNDPMKRTAAVILPYAGVAYDLAVELFESLGIELLDDEDAPPVIPRFAVWQNTLDAAITAYAKWRAIRDPVLGTEAEEDAKCRNWLLARYTEIWHMRFKMVGRSIRETADGGEVIRLPALNTAKDSGQVWAIALWQNLCIKRSIVEEAFARLASSLSAKHWRAPLLPPGALNTVARIRQKIVDAEVSFTEGDDVVCIV